MKEEVTTETIANLQNKPVSRIENRISQLMLFFEDVVKVPLFRCQHCGECILSSTGFVCSQRCPKRLRNGPCGGTMEGGYCEVYPDRRCIWYLIYKRSNLLKRIELLREMKKIHNWNLEKTSSWLNVLTRRIDPPIIFLSRKVKDELKRKN